MSGRIVGEVLEHAPEDLTQGQLLVLVALAEDAFERDRTARRNVGYDALQRRTRLSLKSIKTALRGLRERGLIRPLHDARIGLRQEYVLCPLLEHHRHAVHVNGRARGVAGTPLNGHERGEAATPLRGGK